jgi:hypothetical protein
MIRLPVSAARVDAIVAGWKSAQDLVEGRARTAEQQSASWRALFEAERERCERLTTQLLAMKQQGFQTATERVAPTPQPPSKTEEAIQSKAGNNTALRRHLSNVAAGMQRAQKPDDEIVKALTDWNTGDDEAEHEGRS